MKFSWIQFLGWYGVVAILLAYMLVNFSWLESASILYQLLNLTGSAGIIIVALKKKDVQPAVLNIIWALVALIALVQLIF